MFRRIRIAVLLLLLLLLGLNMLIDRFNIMRWNAPIVAAVYPINGDGSAAASAYIASLEEEDFAPIEAFFAREAREYAVNLDRPIDITLAPPMSERPPKPPVGAGALTVMMWSLHLRWWAWRTPPKPPGPTPRIRLFVLYFEPATHSVLDHSTGLEKGRLGIVHLFASEKESGSNGAVLAHELLHTLGATDKYDLRTMLPRYPDGYADPNVMPRHPQRFAEVMGGRIPLSPSLAAIPDSLDQVVIGRTTAAEIGWLRAD